MSLPESIPQPEVIAAIARLRAAGSPPEVDDEDLALFIDRGIGAVPHVARAGLLRAIGHSPELAAVVAELAASRAGQSGGEEVVARIGPGRTRWRIAWAACALLAVSLTAWIALGGGAPRGPAEVGLLDGRAAAPAAAEQSFSEWFGGTPLRALVACLWVALCILTIPALPPARPSARRGGDAG